MTYTTDENDHLMAKAEFDSVTISFAAVRGIQAGREFFVTMCPLDVMCRITSYNDETFPPEERAQRTLNRRRIPEITKYILDNPRSYVFSAHAVSIDAEFSFESTERNDNSGVLTVPASTHFIINDGQHRRAAILEAVKQNESLKTESIPLVIFIGSNSFESQQMFADLNRYAVRPTKSLSVLYDRRDPVASATLEVISTVPLFREAVEYEKTSLSNRSTKLFTLSNVYQASCKLLNKTKGDQVSINEKDLAIDYWIALSTVIPQWKSFVNGEVKSGVLRRRFVHSHGVVLVALGIAGRSLLQQYPDSWRGRLMALHSIDWRRENTKMWEGVAMEGGKISKAHLNLKLTSIAIKELLGVHLAEEEIEFRDSMIDRRSVH